MTDAATSIIAGTDNDVNNLSIAMTARELNPRLFIVARQNHNANATLFTAFAADFSQISECFAGSVRQTQIFVFHSCGNVVSRYAEHKIFAVSGAGNGARCVVGVSSRADDRSVADAPVTLVRHSARRSSGGEIAVFIERDRADRAEFVPRLFRHEQALLPPPADRPDDPPRPVRYLAWLDREAQDLVAIEPLAIVRQLDHVEADGAVARDALLSETSIAGALEAATRAGLRVLVGEIHGMAQRWIRGDAGKTVATAALQSDG